MREVLLVIIATLLATLCQEVSWFCFCTCL